MEIKDWDKRYKLREHASDFEAGPTPLVMNTAATLRSGKALDLASGAGRNAMWLAERGWKVTAVDGAPAAIEVLAERGRNRGLHIEGVVADLEKHEFKIQPEHWDLILICYYMQRNLYQPAKQGVAPGGVFISIVHMNAPGEADGPFRLRPGQLEKYFQGWQILHLREGPADDPAHQRPVAEIAARKPGAHPDM